jgi:phage shock protein C
MATSRLTRPARGRVLAGVCLGIAERYGWELSIVRVLTMAAVLFTGVGLFIYIALWIVVPAER